MSESLYAAMRAYVDVAVELQVRKALETRSTPEPKIIEGPPGKNGIDGRDGKDGRDGADGKDGTDGKAGERGADGIATLEDLKVASREVFADFQVRTFADIYRGVYKPGESYTRSNFTTWGGSLWLALTDTQSKPGETPDWKLVVKK